MAQFGSAQQAKPVQAEFHNDVIPVLSKMGCNAGACHGAAIGRGGFSLSLYGSKPDEDFDAIVRQLQGRRVNLADPEESLVFKKPAEYVEHGGGTIFAEDDPAAQVILDWIRAGATSESSRSLDHVVVSPRRHVAKKVGDTFSLKAVAHYTDGSTRDVTDWTIFTAEDNAAVAIDDKTKTALVNRRGRHIVIARYLDEVVPIEVIVPLTDKTVDLSDQTRVNFIDDEVLEQLATLRLPVSPSTDDATFLRRVTLDLTGRLPTADEVDRFLNESGVNKRKELVDRLLDSNQFNQYWTYELAKLLRIRPQLKDSTGAETYHQWLYERVSVDTSYRDLAKELLLATGDTYENGPANFYQTTKGAREQAEFVSELFMASRVRCANCHDHPLDHWTQDDYHGLAAVFAKVQGGRFVNDKPNGEVIHPATLEPAIPKVPGTEGIDAGKANSGNTATEREQFTNWLVDKGNPYFAKAIVNRLWKRMMGRGLVEAPDDFRSTNPATHPQLLEMLAKDFVDNGYSLRHTLRVIANSSTYARSSTALESNKDDDRFYSHALRRDLEPEVLADAISDVLGISSRYGNHPAGTRAVELVLPNTPSPALDILGRCGREESCEGNINTSGGLAQKLHMFNGDLLNARISATGSRLEHLLKQQKNTAEVIREFYVVALGRYPTETEKQFWHNQAKHADDQSTFLEDFVWGILNSADFSTNH